MHRQKFKVKLVSAEDKKTDVRTRKASLKNLSPSQKIIREFKKSELSKYGATPQCPDAPRASTTEWQVLYTTQLTQKAKKYHDGFLKLAISGSQGRQVMLYDATRRLLDSRFLKKDEMIKSGESLILEGHLVDIGELEGDNEALCYSNLQESNGNVTEKTDLLHGQQVKRLKMQKYNSMEYRRTETNEHSASPNCPHASKTSATEWQVLYTTQLTQKAKKFHDGFLKLSVCGSQGRRQVFLYDEHRRLLDSRFLKSDETVRSGESLKLDCHLVDIGEIEADAKPQNELNLKGSNCIVVGETGSLHEEAQTHTNYPVEWDVLYTSQITQKSKKYHTGILRLASCGSYRMQVTLLAEDGTVLSRRYLKLSEHLNSGSAYELPNYLVEVGEPCKHHDEPIQINATLPKSKDSQIESSGVDNFQTSRAVIANKYLRNAELESKDSPSKESDLIVRSSQAETNTSRENITNKPCRDANTILSILKKPAAREGIVLLKRQTVQCLPSETSDFAIIQGILEDSHSQSSLVEDNKSQETTIISGASDIFRSKFDLEFGNSSRSTQTSITQAINALSDCQPSTASVPHDVSVVNNEIKASSFSFSRSSKKEQSGKLSQPCADDIGVSSKCNEASGPCHAKKESSSTSTSDEFPSFDLGF